MISRLDDISVAKITDATIEAMHQKVKDAKTDPRFIELIVWVVRNVPGRDDIAHLKLLYSVFHKKIKYVRDPYQVEKVQGVWTTLKTRAGDCDDSATFIAAAAGVLGYKYRFVTIKADEGRPEDWSHVYTQVCLPKSGWTTVDISLAQPAFGYTPKGWQEQLWPEPVY